MGISRMTSAVFPYCLLEADRNVNHYLQKQWRAILLLFLYTSVTAFFFRFTSLLRLSFHDNKG